MSDLPKSEVSPYFIIDREIDHASQAKSNNIWQFKGQDNIEKLIDVLLGQMQNTSSDILTTQKGLSVEYGYGWLLDLVGKSLQAYRGEGQSDEDFRRVIVQKIVEDSSQGTINDLIATIQFFVAEGTPIEIREATPATALLQVPYSSLDFDQDPISKFNRAVSAGVGSEIHVSGDDDNPVFSFHPDEGGFSATGYFEKRGSLTSVLKDRIKELAPFRLDVQPGVNSGFSSLGTLDQGQLVDLSSYVDTTNDGIPDSPAVKRIEAKNYYPQ
jgi:hypothetical protein